MSAMPSTPDKPVAVPLSLLLALKAQIEADAVELESTTRWCRDLPKLIEQDAMPEAWGRLVALLREGGNAS